MAQKDNDEGSTLYTLSERMLPHAVVSEEMPGIALQRKDGSFSCIFSFFALVP